MRRRMTAAVGGTVLAAIAVVTLATLTFPTAPEPRALSTPTVLPHALEQVVFLACLPGLYPGSGGAGSSGAGVFAEQGFRFSSDGSDTSLSVRIESVGDWAISVTSTGASMRSERSSDDPQRITSISAAVTPTARSLYQCMAPYRFAGSDAQPPRSRAQLLQLYRYETAVLWPCLTSHGIDAGAPPSRSQFIDTSSALTTNPLSAMRLTRKTLPRLVPALQACPLLPDYLR
jgi:hypothetical protein